MRQAEVEAAKWSREKMPDLRMGQYCMGSRRAEADKGGKDREVVSCWSAVVGLGHVSQPAGHRPPSPISPSAVHSALRAAVGSGMIVGSALRCQRALPASAHLLLLVGSTSSSSRTVRARCVRASELVQDRAACTPPPGRADLLISRVLYRQTRLFKGFDPFEDDEKARIRGEVHRLIAPRDSKYQSNFVEFRSNKLVYRRYAGLFFSVCIDSNDNELAYLEAIHLFVEVLGARVLLVGPDLVSSLRRETRT